MVDNNINIDEYSYNDDLGLETITNEYKLFTFNPILVDPSNSLELLKTKKWVFNTSTIESVKNYLKLYLPKYISAYTHPVTQISHGNLYIGIDDDGIVYGVPYLGKFPIKVVQKEITHIFDKMVRIKDYSYSNSQNYLINLDSDLNSNFNEIFDDIFDETFDYSNNSQNVELNLKLIKEYKEQTKIQILKVKKQNWNKPIISTYDQYIGKLEELEKTYGKYQKKKMIWKKLILSHTNKLHDMLNDLNMRSNIIDFIKEKSNYSKKMFKNKYSDLNYLIDIPDYYNLLSELRSGYKYSSMKYKNTEEFKNNPTNIYYWVTRWKDSITSTLKQVKPKTPKYYSNKNYPMFLLSQVHQMIPEWCESNPNLELYLIKIKIPGNIDKTKVIEYYDGSNWIENYRKINSGSPTSVPVYSFV